MANKISNEVKTIFIASFHPYTGRNIFQTKAFELLSAHPDLWIVIFVPGYKKEYFQKQFGRPNVIIEGSDFDFPSKHRLSLIMKRIAKYGLYSNSTRIERERKRALDGRMLYYLGTALLALIFSRLGSLSRIKRKFFRKLDFRVAVKDRYKIYFDKYKPDLVWATDIQSERDVELLHNAKFFGVKTVGSVRAWDNLTLHGLIRVLPDVLLVPADKIKEQAVMFDDMPSERVKVVGVSHYDRYLNLSKQSKNDFLTSVGFSGTQPSNFRPLVLWTPIGDNYLEPNDIDPYVFEILGKIDADIFARFSPTIPVKKLDSARPFPNMVIDRPGVNFRPGIIGDQEMSDEDDLRLAQAIYFSDVVVCGPTTVALDAVFLDKPVILIGFHPTPKSYLEGILRRYDYDHFKFAIDCGAFRVVKSKEELLKYIDLCSRDPNLGSHGREILREAYCGPGDGESGKRTFNEILQCFSKNWLKPR